MSSPTQVFVATLIAPAPDTELATALADLQTLLAKDIETNWLEEGRAVDLIFEARSDRLAALRTAVAAWCQSGDRFDVVLQPLERRRKRLFLADMDSTMIGQECIDELADFVGLKQRVSAITERAMRGEIAFEAALRERVALLEGLPVSTVDEIIASRLTLTPGGRTLVQTMKADGAYTCLVSGGFTLFTAPVAARIGFDENRGNTLLTSGDRLSGHVSDPILGQAAKLATLLEMRTRLGLSSSDTLAVGDGANDLAMIGEAGLGVAFHAKPAVAAAAAARLDRTDLTSLLFAQGYSRSDFVANEGEFT